MSGRNIKKEQVKVKRYWPGKAPEGADEHEYSSSSDEDAPKKEPEEDPVKEESVSVIDLPVDAVLADRRLQRLNLAGNSGQAGARDVLNRYESDNEDSEESEEDMEDLRAKLRQAGLQRQREEKSQVIKPETSEEEEEEEESEESSEESSEEDDTEPMLKPVFVPKSQRFTIIEREKREAELREAEKLKEKEKEMRRQQSVQMVQDLIRQELEEAAIQAKAVAETDDTDGIDQEAEFEAWKLRELIRIKRDAEEKDAHEQEQAEIERRRNMTEEERMKEDLEKVKQQEEEKLQEKLASKQVFLQKYHHKGAFYMDKDDEIFKRDYAEPTESEVINRELLPKVMQVKNFGLAGRTKYTHLADQDTTGMDAPWNQTELMSKRTLRMFGGMHDVSGTDDLRKAAAVLQREKEAKRPKLE
ncbi:hypothetical protein DSO57_1032781 [Entomophthora muscae]|uniref:Uncharacterized protein n=2 Tax=Entomophthora muscae TaxID=34485 RepID=A0ACC2UKP5_9FUNG|nr:hypothetical protein DSO57_1032781 [Entomophthora muscae]